MATLKKIKCFDIYMQILQVLTFTKQNLIFQEQLFGTTIKITHGV